MPGAELSDNQLAALTSQGDADAYRRLFERYQNPVYNFVYRMVNNAEDASDIVQNAFMKMYTVLGEKEVQNFSAYLYRTARNLAYDEIRRRSRFADVDEELLVPEDPNIYADPQRALQLQEQIRSVRQAASRLNENQRAALIMRELQDMDYDQMSVVLDSNRNAVGAMLSRARLRFREELRMAQVATDNVPPECERIISLLSPYIDNELDDGTRAEVDDHLRDCTFCTAALEEMREASRSFRMLIPVVPPPDLAEAFEGSLQQLASGQAGQIPEPEMEPTSVYQQAAPEARRSLLRSRSLWITIAASLVMVVTVFALAESTGRERLTGDELLQEERLIEEQTEDVATVPQDTVETQETAPAETEQTPADNGGTPADTPARTPIEIGRTTIKPNPVYEDGNFTINVIIDGSADSVTASIKGMYDLDLTRVSSHGGKETWSVTARAGGYGNYPVYISASGSDGGSAGTSAGTLEVLVYLY